MSNENATQAQEVISSKSADGQVEAYGAKAKFQAVLTLRPRKGSKAVRPTPDQTEAMVKLAAAAEDPTAAKAVVESYLKDNGMVDVEVSFSTDQDAETAKAMLHDGRTHMPLPYYKDVARITDEVGEFLNAKLAAVTDETERRELLFKQITAVGMMFNEHLIGLPGGLTEKLLADVADAVSLALIFEANSNAMSEHLAANPPKAQA